MSYNSLRHVIRMFIIVVAKFYHKHNAESVQSCLVSKGKRKD